MATNPVAHLDLPPGPIPDGQDAAVGVSFTGIDPGGTYTITITKPDGSTAVTGTVTFEPGVTPTVVPGPPTSGQWNIQASAGTLASVGPNQFKLTE